MKILVVEDDNQLRISISEGLVRAGFSVDSASEPTDALKFLDTNAYDIVLTDLIMPGGHTGHWLIDLIRRARSKAIIIVITGQTDTENKLEAFGAGADDYVAKPFLLSELVDRIHEWVERRERFLPDDIDPLYAGDLSLDIARRRAIRGETIISLNNREWSVLELLVRRKNSFVSADTILKAAWSDDPAAAANLVHQTIAALRSKLEPQQLAPLIIEAPSLGYKVDDRKA